MNEMKKFDALEMKMITNYKKKPIGEGYITPNSSRGNVEKIDGYS